ncbi:hypothetical protein G7Z17_g4449 [Cylindrodendrum hubeiense]|uniref:Endo-chitosanase n=1 Tax=Cylindrodendrum hubeiense TaxID=595255 RepID=A0A9P5LCL6_9HYPO|nr:hypothetical protein G7Z17_g4449 [Cylindrodendrum hubeiense]
MPSLRNPLLASLLIGLVSGRTVPTNVKNFYDAVVAQGKCNDALASGFHSIDGDSGKFSYCGDHVDDYNVIYIQGRNGSLPNMDIDCDGIQGSDADDGRCESSDDTQSMTSFKDTVEGYRTGQKDLDSNIHPYVVFGNEGTKKNWPTFDPQDYGIEPLSIIAVIYGIWGDENGDDGDESMVGEASVSLATACFGKEMNGNNGYDGDDVLYIAFPGTDAVPGAKGALWKADDYDAFEASITAQGDKLIARIANASTGSNGTCTQSSYCATPPVTTGSMAATTHAWIGGQALLGLALVVIGDYQHSTPSAQWQKPLIGRAARHPEPAAAPEKTTTNISPHFVMMRGGYVSRHDRRPVAGAMLWRRSPKAWMAYTRTAVKPRPAGDEAALRVLMQRGIAHWDQADAEQYEEIAIRDEDREEARRVPLRTELESYFDHLKLPPLPPPLPRSSLWLGLRRPCESRIAEVRPFLVACEQGDLDDVKAWIKDKKDVLQKIGVQDGLACAADANQPDVARYLLDEAGASVHGAVVQAACRNRSLPLLELCVQHGYHPDQQIPANNARM